MDIVNEKENKLGENMYKLLIALTLPLLTIAPIIAGTLIVIFFAKGSSERTVVDKFSNDKTRKKYGGL